MSLRSALPYSFRSRSRAAVLACFVAIGVLFAGCSDSKPDKDACRAACEHSVDLTRKASRHGLTIQMGPNAKKIKEALAKEEEQWQQLESHRLKQLEDCARHCLTTGTRAQVECVMKAENLSDVRACQRP